jgi:NhaP-type Na+/H+ or K+/H+ antiporter
MRTIHSLVLMMLAAMPTSAWAAPGSFRDVAELILQFFSRAMIILISAAVVGLAFGVIMYFAGYDDPKRREMIRPYLVWAVIGIAVLVGVWGLVSILTLGIFGLDPGIPQLTPPTP